MSVRFLLLLSVAAEVQGQPDPAELLKLAQAKIVDSLNRLPRYMCTQTIDRSVYVPDVPLAEKPCDENGPGRSLHLLSSDRLRLDVSTVSTGEMYSWVGQRRFDDRDLLEMVDYGSIETGEFAAFLSEIFQGDHARFTYNGRTVLDGRTLAEFGFRVSYENSRYSFGNGQHRVITGYDGTFLIDPTTTDLVQLIVRTNQLPSETGTCYASTTLNYARVNLKGDNVLLPRESLLYIYTIEGGTTTNRTAFSDCHEFLGESTLTFDSRSSVIDSVGHNSVPEASLFPPGLPFRVALTEGIDTATAAAGDPLRARLVTPIRDGAKVLAPVGARVAGRIVRLAFSHGAESTITLEFKLDTVDIGGVATRLTAISETRGSSFQKTKRGTLQRRVDLGTLHSLKDRSAEFVFRQVTQTYLISSGLESAWVTAPAPNSDLIAPPAK